MVGAHHDCMGFKPGFIQIYSSAVQLTYIAWVLLISNKVLFVYGELLSTKFQDLVL